MPFTCKVGDTFCLADSSGHHRYVILTKPNGDGNIVLTNFTSAEAWKDCSVIFRPRDNKKLFTKRTTIDYSYATLISASKLMESEINNYVFCDLDCVRRIVEGALQSQHTPLEIVKELKSQYST